jgi:hypothetical protein
MELSDLYRAVTDRFETAWREWVTETYAKTKDDPERFRREAPFPDLPPAEKMDKAGQPDKPPPPEKPGK